MDELTLKQFFKKLECYKCKTRVCYSGSYAAIYCMKCNEWRSEKCIYADTKEGCPQCSDRPKKPLREEI